MMLRVLMVAPSMAIVGGHSAQAATLLYHYARHPGIEARLLTINPRLLGPFAALAHIKYLRTMARTAVYLMKLLALAPRYDVLHVFAAGYWSFLLAPVPALIIGRILGKRVILNYHDGRAEDHLRKWPFAKRFMRLAHVVVAPSRFLVGVFERHGIPARAIANVVDGDPFRFRQRGRPRPVFLHTRGLEPIYNVPCTIRAFARVQRRYPDATLTIAHDGPQRRELEEMVRRLNLRHVAFTGFVPRELMPALYDRADIYLTSTNADNMPLSLVEAFWSGLPVIWTRVGGVPDLIADGQSGLLVDPDDDEAMAASAFRYLEEPGLVERITRAAGAECDNYSWGRIGPQWLALYDELARGRIDARAAAAEATDTSTAATPRDAVS